MIDAIVINSYIMYKCYYPDKYKTRADYMEALILGLAGIDIEDPNATEPIPVSPIVLKRYQKSSHIPAKMRLSGRHYPAQLPKHSPGSKCAYCRHYCENVTANNSTTYCQDCSEFTQQGKVYLHINCFAKWHQEEAK